jgi:hypothetical protein
MEDDVGLHVPVREHERGVGEPEHLHARAVSVRRRGEIGVVAAALVEPVVRLGQDGIVAGAPAPEVVHLEVSRGLVESQSVQVIVDEVRM